MTGRAMCRAVVPLALAAFLGGCSGDRSDATATAAPFDPLAFFDGRARSHGTVTTALVSKEDFTADFEGKRENGALALDERFHFPDAERLQRWRLRADGKGGYAGTVETEAGNGSLHAPVPVSGTREPDGVELDYDGYAPGGNALLHFRHHMTPQGDGTVLNRVRVSRFGLPLAGARVVFERVPNGAN